MPEDVKTDHDPDATEMVLKPCPFCGGEAYLDDSTDNSNLLPFGTFLGSGPTVRIMCLDHKCIGHEPHMLFVSDKTEAIAAWNRRTPEPGTSVVRWVRYDGTPETMPDEDRAVMVSSWDGFGISVVDNPVEAEEIICTGDLWAYLPEPPEGMG